MDLDTDRSTLICRSKLGHITVVQIINRTMLKSQVIATIQSYQNLGAEHQTSFKWLSRMSSYVEGTSKGFMRVRKVESGSECMLMLQSDFAEQVRMIHYNKAKNVLFASSRDGQFRVWKSR